MTTYDAGVLIAADRGERSAIAFHRSLLLAGVRPLVPAPVLAQVWRGGPQAGLSQVLRGCEVVALTQALARRAGELLASSGGRDVVDAAVVAVAESRGGAVVTSDAEDIERLGRAARRALVVTGW